MNIDALMVLQRSDVDHIAENRERFADTRLLFIDAGILEAGLQAGLQNYELRRIQVAPDLLPLNLSETVVSAAAIDLALTEVREEVWGSGAFHGWDQGLLHVPLMRAHTLRGIARAIESSWPEQRLGLLRPANPAASHWDSMLSTDIVAANPARWSVVGSYPSGRYWSPAMLQVCFDFAGVRRLVEAGDGECLTHIPTCLYDAPAFEAAVSQTFTRNIDLPSLMWDVPLRRGTSFLLQRIEAVPIDADCVSYRERARQIFSERLARLIPSQAALTQQADAFASRCHLQAVNFVGLRRALAGSRPHFVLSDHDAGNNGPLFSVAAELDCAITVLPHSAYPTSLMPHARRVTAIELEGVGVPVRTVLGVPVPTRAVRFRASATAADRTAPRRVCLLLNSMEGDSLSYVDFFALIKFHKALAALCAAQEWALSVRLKPGSPGLNVVASALAMPTGYFLRTMAQPIDEVARDADICIAFGEPTSATIAFFNAGSLMLHVSDQQWPRDYRLTTPLAELMPTQGCDEAIAGLALLMRDSSLYSAKQRTQSGHYAERRIAVHDTIFTGRASSPPNPLTP